jgi:hypothetical protein
LIVVGVEFPDVVNVREAGTFGGCFHALFIDDAKEAPTIQRNPVL